MSITYRKRLGFMPNPAVAAEIAALDAVRDCQRIVHLLVSYEFAWDITRALEVALFYTYGSASVSRLLDRTREFSDHGQKRYDDTRLLIAHFMESGWERGPGARALARINQTHGNYRIPNDDFLFVLWTFIDFPLRWTEEYGRRGMTVHEQRAWFEFWSEIGRRMGLRDVPADKPAFDAFIHDYRLREFVPDPASARVAAATVRIVEGWLPAPLQGLVSPAVYSLIDDPLFMDAIGVQPPSPLVRRVVRASLRRLGQLKRHWAIGEYPGLLATQLNRTYPGNRYEIEALEPAHLQRRAARAVSSAD